MCNYYSTFNKCLSFHLQHFCYIVFLYFLSVMMVAYLASNIHSFTPLVLNFRIMHGTHTDLKPSLDK